MDKLSESDEVSVAKTLTDSESSDFGCLCDLFQLRQLVEISGK